jgi:hypothetical protein
MPNPALEHEQDIKPGDIVSVNGRGAFRVLDDADIAGPIFFVVEDRDDQLPACCRRAAQWHKIGCEPGDEGFDILDARKDRITLLSSESRGRDRIPQRCWRCLFRDHFGPFYAPLRLWQDLVRNARWCLSPHYRARVRAERAKFEAAFPPRKR